MGKDKALLRFGGRPMVEIAVEKLRSFCASVSISGNRTDLGSFAPVVFETRLEAGPAAGIEAGLTAAEQPWVLFMPVDVPLVPAALLRSWAEATIDSFEDGGPSGSFLVAAGQPQPAFCMLRRECLPAWTAGLEGAVRRLEVLLARAELPGRAAAVSVQGESFAPAEQTSLEEMTALFSNVNSPQELADAESRLASPNGPAQ